MYALIKNENYGYAVATYGDYVAVGNPAILRWTAESMSVLRTGSLDYFRYNKNTDQHDYIGTVFKQVEDIDVILIAESASTYPLFNIDTEDAFLPFFPEDLLIDKDLYTSSVDDGFGVALDMYEKNLVVGSPYWTQIVATTASVITASGATVELHDLSKTELGATASTYLYTIYNPDTAITNSFGHGVSINSKWIAIGSPEVSSSAGMVYMYRNRTTGSAVTWSLYQKLNAPSGSISECLYGWDLKLNKQSASYSQSMIVGCGNPTNAQAYYYELITGSWTLTHTFNPTYDWKPLTFGQYMPYQMDTSSVMNVSNGYGQAVSLFDSTVVIGAPYDRAVYEFSGSNLYQQGATYVYENCNLTRSIEIPRMPNDQIQWNVSSTRMNGTLLGQVTSSETHPHFLLYAKGRVFGGGWDGKLFVLNDPDGDLSNITTASFIGGTGISQAAYSDATGHIYVINGATPTGSIVRIDPDDIVNGQTRIVSGLAGYPSLPGLAADDNYLYSIVGGAIRKWDINTGALVSSAVVSFGSHGGGVFSPDGQWVYFCGGSYVSKINTTTLSSSYTRVIGGFGFYQPSSGSQQMYYFYGSTVDDMVYLNGYLYVQQDQSSGNFGLWKINADNMTWTPYTSNTAWDVGGNGPSPSGSWSYPTKYGGWGMITDGTDLYVLQDEEVWIYPEGNLDLGPVRYLGADNSNECCFTDGGRFIVTLLTTNQIRAYNLQRSIRIPYSQFNLNLKTYGTPLTIKNNRMGYSVDAGFGYAVSGIPKINNEGITSCYVGGTLDQLHQCTSDLENALTGQAMLLQKNTSSGDWEIVNVYQRKKRYLSPYRSYGNDVSIDGRSMVVGAPLLLTDSNRFVNLNVTSSSGMVLDDISGKAYIYNLANLRDEFHVGNVFYRNGKIVIMTSGSVFDGLFFNPINANTYEYDLQFKGQHTIFEKQIICQVAPGEFNVSTNPSAIHRMTGSFDVNGNGIFDFQDVDVILRYMQYKNTSTLGLTVSTDWSSSVLKADDEKSLYEWNTSQSFYNAEATSTLASESIVRWETEDTWVQNVLDLNEDNKIDIRDMNIVWKYFANRLTQENYATYITPACKKKLFSDVIDYLNFMSQRYAEPEINHEFNDYERLTALDKTGSFLAPYATTIGLFDGLDLVGVAKLGTPIKITPELPINFVVKMDW